MDFYTFLFGDGQTVMAWIPLVTALAGKGAVGTGIGKALLGSLGKAVPFLGSAIFGNLFKSKEKRLKEEQFQLQNEAMKMALGRQRKMDPYMFQAIKSQFGRLPDHMQGNMNQFGGGNSAADIIAQARERKGIGLPRF